MENKLHLHEAQFLDQQGQLRTSKVPVVQELARQEMENIPSRFIQHHDDYPTEQSSEPLPSINLAKLSAEFSLQDRAEELGKLADGARKWGMFIVVEQGIDAALLKDVKDVVKGFFGMSFEDKKTSVGSYMNIDNMGYGRNFVKSENQLLDWIDRLCMKAAPRGASEGFDVWPTKPANFRQVIERYVAEARKALDKLLEALAEALSLERNAFTKSFDPEDSEINVRINYYPPCPRPDLALGINPHTDASVLTLLMQFDISGGLQSLKDGEWLTVNWPSDALLVNFGDFLEIMSNGRVESPWHRVAAKKNVERFSVALFYNPPSYAEIEPMKDEESGGRYKKVTVREYCQHLYKISPTVKKEAIMYARIS